MSSRMKEHNGVRNKLLISLVFLGLIVGAVGFFLYRNNSSADNEVMTLQKRLAQVMELPAEPPTLATVSDASKLVTQAFFSNAQNGDKVLIYPISKKAILYRPSTNKIIEVGPLTINSQPSPILSSPSATLAISPTVIKASSPTPTTRPTTTPLPKVLQVAIYNGTNVTGLTSNAAQQLEETNSIQVQVIQRTNAVKRNYTDTLVVDISGKKTEAAQVANVLNGKVVQMPLGEKKPNADVLVILGSSYKK